MTKNSYFLRFLAISLVIAHSFGVQGRFTCLRNLTKKSSFLRFIAVFMSNFGVPGRFIRFKDMIKNSPFCVYGHFMSYCPQFWFSRAIYEFERFDQKVVIFAFYGRFHELLPIVLGFQD